MIRRIDAAPPWDAEGELPLSILGAPADCAGAPNAGGAGALSVALDRIRRKVARAGEICAVHVEPPRAARFDDGDLALDPRVLEALRSRGMWPLWSHQGEAIRHVQAGRHVVVASSTASGKSLCYNLPVLDAMLGRDNAYALYLFPTKALSQDQMRALGAWIAQLGISAEAGIYDGDTEPVLRRRLRRNGRIIITNPDMLHASILPHHGGWGGLFRNLRFVVVDELHTLRGIFGSHAGNVLRRLRRLARHHGSDPIFIGASATIANPGAHAERLLGVPVEVVTGDGAPRGEKTYFLWNPPLVEGRDGELHRKGAPSVAVRLLPELVRSGAKAICFGRTRNTVELILRYVRERARERPGMDDVGARLEAYRGGYLPNERREIERKLFGGELGGVVATNALELGIDIGALDSCIIAGWPGSVASFLQQAGRAGRRNGASAVFLIGGQEPVDQYFMRHPAALFEQSPEHATAEWSNPYVLVRHLVCAAYELPLGEEDAAWFGADLRAILAVIGEEGRLKEADGRWYFVERGYPAAGVKLRSISDENWTIYELGAERIVGELDYVAGLFSLYEGAVYIHRTDTFLVELMDIENRIVKIRRMDTGYYTQALVQKSVTITEEWESKAVEQARLALAEVDVLSRLTGYKKVRFHSLENVGYGPVAVPPLELDTVALALDLEPSAIAECAPFGADFLSAGLHGLARLFREMLSIRAMCDPADIDTFIDGKRIYLYDMYPGGIGYSEVGYEQYAAVLEATLEALVQCPCRAGCPSCVLPGSTRVETYMEPSILEFPYPKEAARFLLHMLLGRERYVPVLAGIPATLPASPQAPPPELDPRTERKVRKAIRRLEDES
ncbi:MAG: DEAD/DEAH box helicase [Planctomycetes bacterium]|nr:DEAD/DEAH box helicase [Planctomycetota bacterium]